MHGDILTYSGYYERRKGTFLFILELEFLMQS